MQQVKITDLRNCLPEFLKQVIAGEEIQITLHGKAIARIIPETDKIAEAQQRLDDLKGTVIKDDIMAPIDAEWGNDADNL